MHDRTFYLQDNLNRLVDELENMAESLSDQDDLNSFDLRQILRFISKMIQVVEQAFQDLLTVIIECSHVTEDDIRAGRTKTIEKELDLLVSRSKYRDAEEICSRLHNLENFFRENINPITSRLKNDNQWWAVFRLLNEHEGQIIMLVHQFVVELKDAIQSRDAAVINQVARQQGASLTSSLRKLRQLNSQILGLSGSPGLLETIEDSSSNKRKFFINKPNIHMGDTYQSSGQVGAMGPNATVNATFIQQGRELQAAINLSALAEQLAQLKTYMKDQAVDPEHYIALGEVAKAEQEAKSENPSKVVEYLKNAGKWALEAAQKIGVALAVEAIKKSTGMG